MAFLFKKLLSTITVQEVSQGCSRKGALRVYADAVAFVAAGGVREKSEKPGKGRLSGALANARANEAKELKIVWELPFQSMTGIKVIPESDTILRLTLSQRGGVTHSVTGTSSGIRSAVALIAARAGCSVETPQPSEPAPPPPQPVEPSKPVEPPEPVEPPKPAPPQPPAEAPGQGKTCRLCGYRYGPGDAFCMACGAIDTVE